MNNMEFSPLLIQERNAFFIKATKITEEVKAYEKIIETLNQANITTKVKNSVKNLVNIIKKYDSKKTDKSLVPKKLVIMLRIAK